MLFAIFSHQLPSTCLELSTFLSYCLFVYPKTFQGIDLLILLSSPIVILHSVPLLLKAVTYFPVQYHNSHKFCLLLVLTPHKLCISGLCSVHRPLKIRSDGVHARVRELGSIDFSTPKYRYEIWWNYSEMNSVRNADNRKLMTSLPDPERHFKFRNLMKNNFSTKNDCFHHLSEQI